MDAPFTPDAVEHTYQAIAPHIRLTPVLSGDGVEFGLPPFPLTLKLEQTQMTGSFKVRGAFANLLLRAVPAAGVVAASGGNHGAAVAYAAAKVGCPAHIFVPTVASPSKISRIRAYGANLTVVGDRYADALAASEQWAGVSDALQIHAYDQRETILGQGTLGPRVVSASARHRYRARRRWRRRAHRGLAAWYQGRTRVIGVEPRLAPTLTAALEAGRPVDAPAGGIAADSLAPRRVGATGLPLIQACVDRVVLVDDADIRFGHRLFSGRRPGMSPSRVARPRLRRCCLAPIRRRRVSASPSSSAAATRRHSPDSLLGRRQGAAELVGERSKPLLRLGLCAFFVLAQIFIALVNLLGCLGSGRRIRAQLLQAE